MPLCSSGNINFTNIARLCLLSEPLSKPVPVSCFKTLQQFPTTKNQAQLLQHGLQVPSLVKGYQIHIQQSSKRL